jgi:hypothetical protein
MRIQKIVACIGLVIVVVGTVMWLTPSKSCESGTKGSKEVCELSNKAAAIFDESYVPGVQKAAGR